jgi:hypothetical protein
MSDTIEHGEKVQALPAKKRAFVLAFMAETPGPDAALNAALAAGYEDLPGKSLRRQASELLKDKAVIEALKELGCAEVFASIPHALHAIRETLDTVYSKDRLKAAQLVLDRFMPASQKLEIKAEVVDRQQVTLDHLHHLIEIGADHDVLVREFGEMGLQRYTKLLEARKEAVPAGDVIDGNFKVIEPDTEQVDCEPLEDWDDLL